MTCKNCGNELPEGAKFCNKCGTEAKTHTHEGATAAAIAVPLDSAPIVEKGEAIVKCGNCNYIGPGEKNRSLAATILAWLCVCFAPMITIIYFLATHKYRCPKCKSTFLGIKNKDGVFAGQRGGAARGVMIIIVLLVGIAIIGILSSVVLASLNTARQKGADASVKASLASLRAEGALYEDSNSTSKGFCDDTRAVTSLKAASKSASLSQSETNYVCNDTASGWAASVPLRSGGYWCVDSSENSPGAIDTELTTQTSCSGSNSYSGTNTTSASVKWSTYTSAKDGFSILFPATPVLDSKSGIPVDDTDPSFTYSWHSYQAQDNSSSFFVFKYIYSGEGLNVEDPDKVLKAYLNVVANSDNGHKILSSSFTYVNSHRALDFLVSAGKENIKGRFVLVDNTPYMIMMDYFPVNYDADTYSKFINSFKVI